MMVLCYNREHQKMTSRRSNAQVPSIERYASVSPYNTLETIIVPLTQGQETVIDAIDADLALLKWRALFDSSYSNGGQYTALRSVYISPGKCRTEYLHRVILSRILNRPLQKGEEVDHIDTIPLNNRRKNLRLATRIQNSVNQGNRKNNTSGFKGVSWHKTACKWRAEIRVNGKRIYLGLFNTPELAYESYCAAALKYHGEFARLE
jgi:AP2 domain-containing protein/HNH endonuclease